jgi:hypothetical protein
MKVSEKVLCCQAWMHGGIMIHSSVYILVYTAPAGLIDGDGTTPLKVVVQRGTHAFDHQGY